MTIRTSMLLKLVGRKTFTVTTYTGGYVNGRWEQIEGTPLTVEGHEQPSPDQQLRMLPESFRTKDVRLFMTTANLQMLDEGDGEVADKITINNEQFNIQTKRSYQMGPVQHYEYLVVREEQSAGGTQ